MENRGPAINWNNLFDYMKPQFPFLPDDFWQRIANQPVTSQWMIDWNEVTKTMDSKYWTGVVSESRKQVEQFVLQMMKNMF